MSRHILLDSTPLGLLTKPQQSREVQPITTWVTACLAAGHRLYVPEIIDYELRRELIRSSKTSSLVRLDRLKTQLRYLKITTEAMLKAADLWASSRNSGQPTSNPLKLDIDVILAAQALSIQIPEGDELIIATDNVGHLSRFAPAALWNSIAP